jgi:hypothetical protein
MQGNVGTTSSDTALAALQAERAHACRLTPDRALETLDEADAFLHERGLLTRTPCCSLPSLFAACHEEPYAPGKPGFGQWPRTKWSWSFMLPRRPGAYALKIHHRRKTLYVTEEVARMIDPVLRDELDRMGNASPDWARVLDHLAAAGPSTTDDLKTELGLKPRELKAIIHPLELCGVVISRAVEPADDGSVQGFEYVRWDDVFPEAASTSGGVKELIVAAVRSAVLASEREVPRWFPWRWRFDAGLIDRLVEDGRLVRPAPGRLATPASS